jgi:hypothetical protein
MIEITQLKIKNNYKAFLKNYINFFKFIIQVIKFKELNLKESRSSILK